jgi:hypothetical protein
MITIGTVALFLLAIAVIGTLLLSLILYYHWVRFGVGIFGTLGVMVAYAVGVCAIILAALGLFAQL